jgi:hypothetical protein
LVDLMMELVETYKFRLPKFTVSWYIQPHYENYIIHWFTALVYFVWWFIITGNKRAYKHVYYDSFSINCIIFLKC